MKIGLLLNSQAPTDTAPQDLVRSVIEHTAAARDAGFELISMGQHYLTEYHQVQPVPILSRLTEVSGSMTIATGVIILPLHHPIEIAEQISTISLMADETILGVGAGYRNLEFDSFGVRTAERGPRLAEGIELIERLWTEECVTFHGKFHSVTDVSIHPRPATKPSVWIAANSGPAIERAARLGDAWYVNPHSTLSEIVVQKRHYDEIRQHSNRSTAVPLLREGFVAESTEHAVETARPHLKSKYDRYIDWGQDEAMADKTDLHRDFDDLRQDRFLLGTPEEICSELDRYREMIDPSYVIFRLGWPGLSSEATLTAIKLMGDEVIPYV